MLADCGYDPQSRRTSLAHGNGGTSSYGYTAASRLSALNHGPLDGVNTANWAYSYTPAGQLATRTFERLRMGNPGARGGGEEGAVHRH